MKYPNSIDKAWLLHFAGIFWLVLILASTTLSEAFAQDGGYYLGPGDTVKITVYEHPDLAMSARINHLGFITFPFLKSVKISGLTPDSAGQLIADRLEKGGFVKAPQVTLVVEVYRSHQVSILGQTKKPGKYFLEGKTTLIDVIAQSGGLRDDAADIITVVRNRKGNPARYQIDMLKFYSGDMSQNIDMVNGDIILIPKMDKFYIYGEVKKPGDFRLERGMTLMQALSVAGGLTGRGSSSGITVNRPRLDGSTQNIEIELIDIMKPNDVIYVKERLF